jgi:hypothetical protein
VDTKGRLGHLVKHVVVHSTDGVSPTVTLTLMMEVVAKRPFP